MFDPTTLVGFHTWLSLIALGAGLIVAAGLFRGQNHPTWTALFLATAVGTERDRLPLPVFRRSAVPRGRRDRARRAGGGGPCALCLSSRRPVAADLRRDGRCERLLPRLRRYRAGLPEDPRASCERSDGDRNPVHCSAVRRARRIPGASHRRRTSLPALRRRDTPLAGLSAAHPSTSGSPLKHSRSRTPRSRCLGPLAMGMRLARNPCERSAVSRQARLAGAFRRSSGHASCRPRR